ncbi:hypothetical protein LY76DRAFT_214550 [Colletotrichum caudatum]|nr:hypothetical protein LY76DRAFT_214550 [Colletotrichum caudatum]
MQPVVHPAAPCIRTDSHPFSTMSPQTSCRHCLQSLILRLDGLIPSTFLGRPGLDLFKDILSQIDGFSGLPAIAAKNLGEFDRMHQRQADGVARPCLSASSHRSLLTRHRSKPCSEPTNQYQSSCSCRVPTQPTDIEAANVRPGWEYNTVRRSLPTLLLCDSPRRAHRQLRTQSRRS